MRGRFIKRRGWLLCLSLIFLTIQILGAGTDNHDLRKGAKKGKLGDSITLLRRDNKTGRLVTPKTDPGAASYVEKAAATAATDQDDSISLDSNLFAFEVTVQDPISRQYVLNLKQEDFQIFDDEEDQPVTYYVRSEVEKTPTNIVLILDHSGSVTPYWEESKKAALNFVHQLKPEYQSAALVLDDPTLLVDFTKDPNELEKALTHVKLIKHTYNFTSLLAVLNEMFADRDGRKIVIFQTDGDEALKLVPLKDWPADVTARFEFQPKFYTLKDIVDFAGNSGVTVYSIAVGSKLFELPPGSKLEDLAPKFESEGRDPKLLSYFRECQIAMKQVADVTGGSISYMAKASDAGSIYNSIKEDLRARYIIGFYPSGNQTNRYHRISVRVKDHPDWQVTSRQGYYATAKPKR